MSANGKGNEPQLLERLRLRVRALPGAVVAFSGGADSSLLLRVCHDELGGRVLAVTAASESLSQHDREWVARMAAEIGARHRFVETREIEREGYAANSPERCFFCKDELFTALARVAREEGLEAVLAGYVTDDEGDFRPGMRAARDHGVLAPLLDARIGKVEVREFSKLLGLSTWDRPAAPCLSSRIAYGVRVTPERLRQVEAAEALLRARGFREFRVRHHGSVARIEVPSGEIAAFLEPAAREAIVDGLRQIGFVFVTLDLVGFRSGSLNAVLAPTAHA
ncbi:MAG: ATP-dependent sacrificial sulfur transferase LarE [Planctomycetes bacterium]|nr:ATP-dependent sacrificial sulfur transferase LarE [Planctomycetota bacterium]MBI3845931.1 ATP-dependent sacrificial sulfur transferase LarE [Planctomycetota bacterium]